MRNARALRNDRASERGIALIAVIAALSALLLIAVPFSMSMRDHRESATAFSARAKTRAGASSVLAYAKAQLARTHESIDETPEYDTPDELRIEFTGLPFRVDDPKGLLWSVDVEDEQGKIALDSASPFLLGNLLGIARVSAVVAVDDISIPVDDLSRFSPDGGMVWIGGELVRYESTGPRGLQGCERGVQVEWARFLNPMEHDIGAIVLDARAVILGHLGIYLGRAENRVASFGSRTAVKRIADFSGLAFTTEEVDRLMAVSTVHALRPGAEGFGDAQEALDPLSWFEEDDLGGRRLMLQNARYMNAGTLVEVSDGERKAYTVINRPAQLPQMEDERVEQVVQATIGGNAQSVGAGQITTSSGTTIEIDGIERILASTVVPPQLRNVWFALPFEGAPGFVVDEARTLTIKSRPRHPVNINTASDEVLRLVLTNLQVSGSDDVVTAGEADALIARIRREPVKSHQDLLDRVLTEAVEAGVISEADVAAIYYNALNANDAHLVFATQPFCYKSENVFSIEATAIVNNRAGMELDRESIREVVHVGPGEIVEWTLDTQEDFERQIITHRDGKYLVTYPNAVAKYDYNNNPASRFSRHRFAGIHASTRLEDDDGGDEGDVRLRPSRSFRRTNIEHFDGELDHDGLILDGGTYEAPMIRALETEIGMAAGFARFWFQLPDGGSDVTLFDGGESTTRNRVRLFYDPGEGALRLQVFDATQPDTSIPGGESAMEARHPIQLDPETWYHVTASWRGTKPGDLTILVDGINRTEHRYRTVTTESLGTDITLGSISVEDASSFPPSGALAIGREVVEYTSRSDTSFNLRVFDRVTGATRGMNPDLRGLKADPHEAGVTIELFGYANALESELRPGGAALASDLGRFAVAKVKEASPVITHPPSGLPYMDDAAPTVTATLEALPEDPNPDDFADAFQEQGYALLCCSVSASGVQGQGMELAFYEKVGDTQFEFTRGLVTPGYPNNNPDDLFFDRAPGATNRAITVVIPVSVHVSGSNLIEGYIDPSIEGQMIGDGTSLAESERIQIDREWFRYESILDDAFFLRDDAAAFLRMLNRVDAYRTNGVGSGASLDLQLLEYSGRADSKTEQEIHSQGIDVIPCFRVYRDGTGFDDVVTLLTPGGGGREQAVVVHGNRGRDRQNRTYRYVGLDRNVSRTYPSTIQDILINDNNAFDTISRLDTRQTVRISKFPSGELPTSVPTTLGFGAPLDGGSGTGMILDEVEINRMREVIYMVNLLDDTAAVPASDRDVPLVRADFFTGHGMAIKRGASHYANQGPRFTPLPPDGGALWIGDEIVVYRDLEDQGYVPGNGGMYILKDCIRGAMGTEPRVLDDGERGHLLSYLNISQLTGGVADTGYEFPLADANGFPPSGTISVIGEGYELEEMMHYTTRIGQSLYMPTTRLPGDLGSDEGLFRGRYGTDRASYASGDFVIEMPHRFWDRAARNADDPQMAYLELSRRIPGAYFTTIDWDERLPKSLNDIEVLVRIDERVPWTAEPGGKENGLFRFENPAEDEIENRIDMAGEVIEIRVFFRYGTGAFNSVGSVNDWKDTAWLRSIGVKYLAARSVEAREVMP